MDRYREGVNEKGIRIVNAVDWLLGRETRLLLAIFRFSVGIMGRRP